MRKLSFYIILFILVIIAAFYFYPRQNHKKLQLTDVENHLPDLQFSLMNDKAKAVTEKDYRDDLVLLYFGFTRCPDECPLTMARLGGIIQQLGKEADHIRVLFVTVNPENDTPEVLRRYLAAYDFKHMSGLTGSPREIEALAKRYRAAYRAEPDSTGDFQHSNVVYIFDKTGNARLLAMPDDSDEKIINDLRSLNDGS